MLIELDSLPPGLLETEARGLERRLGAPTLIHLPGARTPALFVSVLLHGNEDVGWESLRALLRERLERFGRLRLPRALSLFIGNVSAAAAGVRHLPGQPDYNRVWPGSELPPSREQDLMRQVVERLTGRGLFASVDLHNNTGLNPHYGCINVLEPAFLHLAALFSRTLVYFTRPRGVQSLALSRLCPAVTLECGRVGDRHGLRHAREYLEACLHLSALPGHPLSPRDIDLFHTVAQVKIPEEIGFGFPPETAELLLSPELEGFNFRELPPGTVFAWAARPDAGRLEVRDESGRDVMARYFRLENGALRLATTVMPAMLTRNQVIIRQDCLGYLMERFPLPDPA